MNAAKRGARKENERGGDEGCCCQNFVELLLLQFGKVFLLLQQMAGKKVKWQMKLFVANVANSLAGCLKRFKFVPNVRDCAYAALPLSEVKVARSISPAKL